MIICSYHSNLYFDSFQLHVEEIKDKGFDTILFCITETDLLFNLESLKEFREYAESEGLQCLATFWGLFAGEAVVSTNTIPGKIELLQKWIKGVSRTGFTDIFIDEPKLLLYVEAFLLCNSELNFHLCLTDETFNKVGDGYIKNLPVKSIGVSCYHWVKDWMKITRRTEAIASRLNKLRPKDNFVFLQGFDIPDGWEDIPLIVKEICEAYGIVNFGFWSFRSTAATSSKRPVNYKMVWEKIKFNTLAQSRTARSRATKNLKG